jgi:ppGpp synthetase/RelA/SpoT-type nucleotidyltranferase
LDYFNEDEEMVALVAGLRKILARRKRLLREKTSFSPFSSREHLEERLRVLESAIDKLDRGNMELSVEEAFKIDGAVRDLELVLSAPEAHRLELYADLIGLL